MVQKRILPLSKLATQVVCENIKTFVYQHDRSCRDCSSGNMNSCEEFKLVKNVFRMPPMLLQDIYDKIHANWERDCGLNSATMLSLFTSLLYFPGLEISDLKLRLFNMHSPFMAKFGTNIQSMRLCSDKTRSNYQTISICRWVDIVGNLSSIRVIDFGDATLTGDVFQIIGKGCFRLEVIKKFRMMDYNITPESFGKLCFQDYPINLIKNSCCDTLHTVEMSMITLELSDNNILKSKINEAARLALENIPNLKSLGTIVFCDSYLKSLGLDVIPKSNLEYVSISNLSKKTILLIEKFCPKMKHLFTYTTTLQGNLADALKTFQYLEIVEINMIVQTKHLLSTPWATLRELNVFVNNVELSVLAEHLLSLKKFHIVLYEKVYWDGTKHFNALTDARISFKGFYSDGNWYESFARTVKVIHMNGPYFKLFNSFNVDQRKILLQIPFPCLEEFNAVCFDYDFFFVSNMILSCPHLRCFPMRKLSQADRKKLTHFMRENNLECDFED